MDSQVGMVRVGVDLSVVPPKTTGVCCRSPLPWEDFIAAGGCGVGAVPGLPFRCTLPPHGPGMPHVSHGYATAAVWGGE